MKFIFVFLFFPFAVSAQDSTVCLPVNQVRNFIKDYERLKLVDSEYTIFKGNYLLLSQRVADKDSQIIAYKHLDSTRLKMIDNQQSRLKVCEQQTGYKDLFINDLKKQTRNQKWLKWLMGAIGVLCGIGISHL